MSTPRQRLKELLFPLGTFPESLDSLMSAASTEIVELRTKLNRQSTMLALAHKMKNDASARATYLSYRLGELERLYGRLREIVSERTADLVKANLELEKLRPPEPKFRVGQVVMATIADLSSAAKLTDRYLFQPESPHWRYKDTVTRDWAESQLRPLTDEEK